MPFFLGSLLSTKAMSSGMSALCKIQYTSTLDFFARAINPYARFNSFQLAENDRLF